MIIHDLKHPAEAMIATLSIIIADIEKIQDLYSNQPL